MAKNPENFNKTDKTDQIVTQRIYTTNIDRKKVKIRTSDIDTNTENEKMNINEKLMDMNQRKLQDQKVKEITPKF